MELIFQTKDGAQLYAITENDEIVSLHSADAHKIAPALKEDLYSKDSYAAYMAAVLLATIQRIGIEWIEG